MTSCVTEQRLRQMLAGHLSVAEEDAIARHLEQCADCERLADQLGDDPVVSDLLALRRSRATLPAEAAIADLRARLCQLGSWPRADRKRRAAPDDREADPSPAGAEPIQVSRQFGSYIIQRRLGAGAFGVVYLARDTRLGREVALKLPRGSVLTDPDLKQRFLREAEALARLDHPNIVPVFEVDECHEPGQRESTCYLAMGFCDGPTLADWLLEQTVPTTPELAVRIVLQLADAAAHAHERQILHRDIKPGNVLLDRPTAGSELPFTPRLTDFGLAKVAESPSAATLGGMVLGTPQYMAPEQAAGHIERIGPATDVYSLGAVLYELLTDRPPIVGNSAVDTVRRVLIDEPAPIRGLRPAVPDDVAAITFKCLDKSPARRYADAAELAADLRRFLSGRPTAARPMKVVERLGRWIRRNPAASTSIALAAIVLLLGAGLMIYDRRLKATLAAAAQASSESAVLQKRLRESDRWMEGEAYVDDVRNAARAIEEGDLSQATGILKAYMPEQGEPDRRGFTWHYLWSRTANRAAAQISLPSQAYQLTLSADGRQLAAACQDGRVRIYNPASQQLLAEIEAGQGEVNGVAFDPGGKQLATAGDDGTVRVWELDSRRVLRTAAASDGLAFSSAFIEDAKTLVTIGGDSELSLWDLTTGDPARRLKGHSRAIEALAVSPDRSLLVTGSSDQTAIVWDLASRKKKFHLKDHQGRLTSVAFSPDGRWFATGSLDQRVLTYDASSGRCVGQGVHLDGIQSLAFAADSERLFSGDRAGTIRVWRLPQQWTGEGLHDLVRDGFDGAWHAHEGKVWSLATLPGGEGLISSGEDQQILFWGHGQQKLRKVAVPGVDEFLELCPAGNSSDLYALHARGVVRIDSRTDAATNVLSDGSDSFWSFTLVEPRGRIATGTAQGSVVLWDGKTRQEIARRELKCGLKINRLAYSAAADRLGAMCDANEVWLLDPSTLAVVGQLSAPLCHDLAFSPDGRLLAVDTLDHIAIFDVPSGRELRRFSAHNSSVTALDWSADGALIASASCDRSVCLWTPDGTLVERLGGHRHEVSSVAFSRDGRSLVSADKVGRVRVTHLPTRNGLISVPTDSAFVRELALLADGRQIAMRNQEHAIVILGVPPDTADNAAGD